MPGSSGQGPITGGISNTGLLPSLAAQTTATGAPATQTPPNNGATGVSTGTIAAGQIANANSNPQYQAANTLYGQLAGQIATTGTAEKNALYNVGGQGDTSLALGRSGQVTNTYSGILQQLAAQQQAAQQQAQNAISEQNQTNTGLASAGTLAQPIVNPQTGGLVNPTANTTTGATISGAANLNSLIGQRPSPSNPSVTEFYNTQTGQGFSNPQDLANFINQQTPGANVNAQNVFQYLSSNGGWSQSNSSLNPLNNIPNLAQQVANGTMSYQDALAQGGTVQNFAGALTAASTRLNPGLNFNTAQGNTGAQQTVASGQAQTVAGYTSALQQGKNLQTQLNDLVQTFGLNPSDINAVNSGLQTIARNTSNPYYQALNNYINDIANTYAQILTPPNGTVTDTSRGIATSMLNATASGTSLATTMASLDQQANAKIAGVTTAPNTGLQMPNFTVGTTAAGGALTWNGTQWVTK